VESKIPFLESLLQCDLFQLNKKRSLLRSPAVSFAEFLNNVYHDCMDPHWKPQAKRMPQKYWGCINFVGHLDHRVQVDTKRLLTKIGAWEEYGAAGWPSGFMFADNQAKHATSAKGHMQHYDNPQLERVVERIHDIDYMHPLFNLTH
jgi:hypothetical protein